MWELHLLHRLVDGAGLTDGRAGMFLLTDVGREMLETSGRGALQARLFRQAIWRTDLSEFVRRCEPRGLPRSWPQGDVGVILWSLSAVVAGEWQRSDTLAALCTVPDDRFVRDALTKAGYAVRVTAEPDEIAGLVRAERPKLMLLDLMLPGTGGIELMAEIPELSELPVIFISATAATRPSRARSRLAPPTTSSSPSHRPSSPRGLGRRYAPERARRHSCSARSSSTTRGAG